MAVGARAGLRQNVALTCIARKHPPPAILGAFASAGRGLAAPPKQVQSASLVQDIKATQDFAMPQSTMPESAIAPMVAGVTSQKQFQASFAPRGFGPMTTSIRCLSDWRLRPYASAGTQGMLPLSSLSAGFSKVGLSILVLPWKVLPAMLVIAPMTWLMPALYRMAFTNSSRHTTASVFTGILYFVLSFLPVPCFENLFSELFFLAFALFSTFFMYQFFPEVLLNDFMFMNYLALFSIPLIPLAFAYMPMFATRSYLFL